jgi:manganese/zinc/iron transport system substrate-binding protein
MRSGFVIVTAVCVIALGALLGCGATNSTAATPAPGGTGKLKVVCTVGMISDIAQRVGGDHVAVQALMGAGTDPHLYKAREEDMRILDRADVIFYNGLNLEGKMSDLLVKLSRKKKVFAAAEYIEQSTLREPPEFEGHFDPHIWFDVSLWMKATERIRDGLIEGDAAHAEDFRKNAETVLKDLKELHAWCKQQLEQIPKEQRVLITAHDAFGYFGRAYDVEVRGIQGISTEDQAAVSSINGLVDLLVKRKIKAVFVESSVSPKNIEALVEGCKSRGHSVVIGGELYSDAMGETGTPDGTYVGMVKHNVETIVKALK